MLSGLETRSLGQHIRHNIVSSLDTVCPCRLSVHRFLDLTRTKHGVNVTCSRPQQTAPGRGLNQGPLGLRSDTLTTAPVRPIRLQQYFFMLRQSQEFILHSKLHFYEPLKWQIFAQKHNFSIFLPFFYIIILIYKPPCINFKLKS